MQRGHSGEQLAFLRANPARAREGPLRGSLRSAFNVSGEIVQRGRKSRRVICSVDPVGHILGPDADA
jgi:hypothetical protein